MKGYSSLPADWNPAWFNSELSQKVFTALGTDYVRVVGGAVRDSLLGIEASDVDMATRHTPEITETLLTKAGIKTVRTGIEHGTVTAVLDGGSCEITTLRKDKETDGRHAVVEFTDDWAEDAARRDFTINALYVSADRMLFDPCDGHADLLSGRVRFIGDASERIKEDALRVLRFYRFSARFSDAIDGAGQRACTALANLVQHLSAERVRDEMLKLLSVERPARVVKAMASAGVLTHIFPNGYDLKSLVGQFERETECDINSCAEARFWILVRPFYGADEISRNFRLSGKTRKFLTQLESLLLGTPIGNGEQIALALYQTSQQTVEQAIITASDISGVTDLLDASRKTTPPVFPVKGRNLLALGMKPGAEMGEHLADLEKRWIDSGFTLSKNQLLQEE